MSRATVMAVAGACALLVSIALLARDVTAGPGAGAAQLRAPMSTGFTYQGYLENGGTPVTGNCAMVFKLFSDQAASVQVGGDDVQLSVDVIDGLFSATLNMAGQFGAGAFDGSERWLQASMNCPGGGGAVVLPVQAIRPAPYAIFASEAATAAQAGNAANLGGFPASQYTRYVRTILVSPGNTNAASGTNLLNAIAGITDASASKTYLIKIEPGIYDLAATQLAGKPFVDIEGSGRHITTITGGRAGALVSLPAEAELRELRVQNLGPAGSIGVSTLGATGTARIRNAYIFASGTAASAVDHTAAGVRLELLGSNLEAITAGGVSNALNATSTTFVSDSSVVLSETAHGTDVRGIFATSSLELVRTSIRVTTGATTSAWGVRNQNGSTSMDNVRIDITVSSTVFAFGFGGGTGPFSNIRINATGAGTTIGMSVFSGAVRNAVIIATAASGSAIGLGTAGSTVNVKDSEIRALGAAPTKHGVASGGDGSPDAFFLDRTTVEGATNAVATTGGSDPVFIGASQLIGGDVSKGAATYKCVNVYGEGYVLLAIDCTGPGS